MYDLVLPEPVFVSTQTGSQTLPIDLSKTSGPSPCRV